MSRRERENRVPLDGLTDAQLEIVRDAVFGELVGKAGDLRLLDANPDPKGAIKEVAALGRLAFWLEHGEVLVPDRGWASKPFSSDRSDRSIAVAGPGHPKQAFLVPALSQGKRLNLW